MTSFWLRKASTLAERRFSLAISFSCCASRPAICGVEPLELLLRDRLALERGAGEVLAVGRERLARLVVELGELLLELLRLQLEPLLRGDDVGDAALDVLQHLELLLVRVVERHRGVLGAVEQLRVPRLDDGRGSAHQAGHVRINLPVRVRPPCYRPVVTLIRGCGRSSSAAAALAVLAGPAAAGAQTAAERELAARYAPVMMLKENPDPPCSRRGEQYVPSPVTITLGNPEVRLRRPRSRRRVRAGEHARHRAHGGRPGRPGRGLLPRPARSSAAARLHLRPRLGTAHGRARVGDLRPRGPRDRRERDRRPVLVLLLVQPVQRPARERLGDDPGRLRRRDAGGGARARPVPARLRPARGRGTAELGRPRGREGGDAPGRLRLLGLAREPVLVGALPRQRQEGVGARLRRHARAVAPNRADADPRLDLPGVRLPRRLAHLPRPLGPARAGRLERPDRPQHEAPVAGALPLDGRACARRRRPCRRAGRWATRSPASSAGPSARSRASSTTRPRAR